MKCGESAAGTIVHTRDESTHLGLGGTSPIFIRTLPGWPRDKAAARETVTFIKVCVHEATLWE